MWFSGPEFECLKIYTDPSEQTSMNENEPPEKLIEGKDGAIRGAVVRN
jgi:hypothetical protein